MSRTTLRAIPLILASACAAPPAAGPPSATPIIVTPVAAPASANPAPMAAPASTPAASPAAAPAPKPIDADRVATLTGGKPETANDVVKVSFPRDDVKVAVDGWKMAPFQGLTSWAAFVPGQKAGIEAMVMGDLVVFEDEVSPTLSAALDGGLEVTALHNHFVFDTPRVFFMHIGGEGSLEQLAKGVKAALDAQRAVRAKAAKPATSFGPPPAGPSAIDAAKLDAVFGAKGTSKDGMYKATMGRKTQAECGCTIGKAMGVNTWAAFAGKDDDAVVDGDFAVAEGELQPVLKALRASGINVVAIHSHMTGESPRILFLHYWGRGKAVDLATAVRKAVDLTAWDGRTQST
jgi:hypothetical protein